MISLVSVHLAPGPTIAIDGGDWDADGETVHAAYTAGFAATFFSHTSARVIAADVGIGRSTVQDYLERAAAAGLGWPLAPDLTDEMLEQLLFPAPSHRLGGRRHPEPDWGKWCAR